MAPGRDRARRCSSRARRASARRGSHPRARRVLLAAPYGGDEPASGDRMRRLAGGVGRSGAAVELELGPLAPRELAALLAAQGGELTDAIAARAEGNPFFAQELLAAAN